MTNSADPDQLASSEANRSGSTLFAKTGHAMFGKRRVNNITYYFFQSILINANCGTEFPCAYMP